MNRSQKTLWLRAGLSFSRRGYALHRIAPVNVILHRIAPNSLNLTEWTFYEGVIKVTKRARDFLKPQLGGD
jgi:hypothetical protein